jgi:hypothetical protein
MSSEELYLSRSENHAELENRMKEIMNPSYLSSNATGFRKF